MSRQPRGFTLVELALVILIISILAFRGPSFLTQIQGSRSGRAVSDMAVMETGLWGFNDDSNGFVGDIGIFGTPANGTALTITSSLVVPPTNTYYARAGNYLGVTYGWNGPYSGFGLHPELMNNDPWLHPYVMLTDGRMQSYGPDGTSGTSDDLWSPAPPGDPPYASTSPPPGGAAMRSATQGTLAITVYDPMGVKISTARPTANLQVKVTNPDPTILPRGNLNLLNATWANGYFSAPNLWPGQHAIEVTQAPLSPGDCNGQSSYTQEFQPFAVANTTKDCVGVYGHAIGYVIGGGTAAVTVRLR